jgi:cytochrome c oxidase assembly factor CtaG
MTFSDSLWYPSYLEPTQALGVDPLADQRLAGLLMWIPGGLVYTGAALWPLTSSLRAQSADGGVRRRSASVESGLTTPSPSDRV